MNLGKLGQAITGKEIFDLIHDDLERVEQEIRLETVASVEVVTNIGRYLQAAGGKRLRPALLLLASKLAGEGGASAIRLGAVVEIIHAATLVHDDVIDDARTRRGRPSANAQWGNHTSVLAGDWLYMEAFQVALRERNFHVLDLLIGLTQMMVEGELLQLERIGRIEVTEADCMELVDRKTACLFSVCSKLGAIVRRYAVNFYGVSSSRLRGQVPTDRLYAEWWLDSDRVCSAAASRRRSWRALVPWPRRSGAVR